MTAMLMTQCAWLTQGRPGTGLDGFGRQENTPFSTSRSLVSLTRTKKEMFSFLSLQTRCGSKLARWK